MTQTLEFVLRHGYTVLFLWVLVEQLGLPLPAVPILLAAGALAGLKQMSFGYALLLAMVAALVSDLLWFELGRRRGGRVLEWLCRISMEPSSCVRRTENSFGRYGARSLLFAKFVPGLNTVAPPLAGVIRMPAWKFLLLDAAGAAFWAGSFLLLGFLFHDQLEDLADAAARLGRWVGWLIAAAIAGYVVFRYLQRRRFLRAHAMRRITPQELKSRLDAGEPLTIVDLRHPLDFLPAPQVIPGALRIRPEEIATRHGEIPRDRDIILYCT